MIEFVGLREQKPMHTKWMTIVRIKKQKEQRSLS